MQLKFKKADESLRNAVFICNGVEYTITQVEKSTLKKQSQCAKIIKEVHNDLGFIEQCKLEIALEDEIKCLDKITNIIEEYEKENLKLLRKTELDTMTVLYGRKALDKEEVQNLLEEAGELPERKQKSGDRTSFAISKHWFWTLKLHKVFDMTKGMQLQVIEEYEHPYVNKFHKLKFTADKIEVWVPERGDNIYCWIKGSSLTYEKLKLFISEIEKYWNLKYNHWRIQDVKEKIKKEKPVSRKDYLPERDINLLKDIEKSRYRKSFWVDYDFKEIDNFIDELKEHSLEMNKLSKQLRQIIYKLPDNMDVDEIIDVLKEKRQRSLDFFEPSLDGPKTTYEEFFDIDRDKQIEQKTKEEFISGRNYRGLIPWWIEEEQKDKTIPGLKEILERKRRNGDYEKEKAKHY